MIVDVDVYNLPDGTERITTTHGDGTQNKQYIKVDEEYRLRWTAASTGMAMTIGGYESVARAVEVKALEIMKVPPSAVVIKVTTREIVTVDEEIVLGGDEGI